ncbi:PAS domain-containing sensor histidine kinase [Actinomadura geliboluensis]|uniref:histidine kinase n=1 Tax=Actinomadura geliboluensis TaxID=882440 RepID=A0A5S4FXG6_9ACTN|nr:PAS domain-containing sensor histidine kinase [Actinomadura geliboluensis]TMR25378.1 PAS domain-containing protein [Actinomadura geliboluensis]
MFEVLPAPCAVLSPDLEFMAVNARYEKAAGLPREELIGREIFAVFPGGPTGEGPQALRASLERVLAEGQADVLALQRYDVQVPGRPGALQERYWNAVNSPLLGPGGRVVQIVHQAEEITEFILQLRRADHGSDQRTLRDALAEGVAAMEAELFVRARELEQTNQRLRQAQAGERSEAATARRELQRQRQVVADTSHDLRSPLTGLQTRLQEALTDPDADSRKVLHAALQDAEKIADIVSDLLELARLDAGTPTDTEPVDLCRLVRDMLERRPCRHALDSDLAPSAPVQGSRSRLTRLLDNLLANAERHARTRIEVTVTTEGDHAVAQITDDGLGIPAGEREAVFRRFYRRADARRTDPGGTGLGLAIARQTAEAHHGTLHIADHPTGIRMVLRLPLSPPPQ